MIELDELRVTQERVAAMTLREQYYLFPGTTTTVCALTLRNGYTVVGESACVHELNFNAIKGREVARNDARAKACSAIAYGMRQVLTEQVEGFADYFRATFPRQKEAA